MRFLLPLLLTFVSFSLFSQALDLSMRLEKNQDYRLFTRSKIEVFEKKKGKVNKTKMDVNANITFHVTKVKNGIFYCDLRYTFFELNIETKDKTMRLSTANTYTDDDYSVEGIMGRVFSEMTKHDIQISMDSKGKILNSTGFENLFADAIDRFEKLPKDKRESLKADIQKKYGKESFAANFELITRVYPKSLVNLNDMWESTNLVDSDKIQFNAINHYQLTEVQDAFVHVDDKIDYVPLTGSEKSDTKKEGQGEGEAYYKLNKKSGWIYEAKVNQRVKLYDDMKNEPENYMLLITETTYSDH